eukprot:TCALIF_05940-PA protein Name:"Protein of unknown function" AED:0.62 eAED:0.62 QI:0/0.33/0/0.5/1/1/4/0/1450
MIGFLWLSLCISTTETQKRPPNYSPDNIPETSFTCKNKITGGYYADPEAECQLFHVCLQIDIHEFRDFKFLCPNDTVFDQQNLVCTNWFEVDCQQSVLLFTNDFGQKQQPSTQPEAQDTLYEDAYGEDNYDYYEYEEENTRFTTPNQQNEANHFLANSSPVLTGNRDSGRGQNTRITSNNGFQGGLDYDEDEDVSTRPFGPRHKQPLTPKRPPFLSPTTTAIPIGVTKTTRRPPRVKSNIHANRNNGNRFRHKNRNKVTIDTNNFETNQGFDTVDEINNFNSHVNDNQGPVVRPDGRPPRVKSNILRGRNRFNESPRNKIGHKVELVDANINFISPIDEDENTNNENVQVEQNTFIGGPEVRPDGRPPRVKSNIRKNNNNKNRFNRKKFGSRQPQDNFSPFNQIPTASPLATIGTTKSPFDGFGPTVNPGFGPISQGTRGPSSVAPFEPTVTDSFAPSGFQAFRPTTPNSFFPSSSLAPSTSRPFFSPTPGPKVHPFSTKPRKERPQFVSTTFRPPSISSTARPLSISSTARPLSISSTFGPVVASTGRAPTISSTIEPAFEASTPEPSQGNRFVQERPRNGFPSFPRARPPGSPPRVKSNVLLRQRGGAKRFRGQGGGRQAIVRKRPRVSPKPNIFLESEEPEFVGEIDEFDEEPRTNVNINSPPTRKGNRITGRRRNKNKKTRQELNLLLAQLTPQRGGKSVAGNNGINEIENEVDVTLEPFSDYEDPLVTTLRPRGNNFARPLSVRTTAAPLKVPETKNDDYFYADDFEEDPPFTTVVPPVERTFAPVRSTTFAPVRSTTFAPVSRPTRRSFSLSSRFIPTPSNNNISPVAATSRSIFTPKARPSFSRSSRFTTTTQAPEITSTASITTTTTSSERLISSTEDPKLDSSPPTHGSRPSHLLTKEQLLAHFKGTATIKGLPDFTLTSANKSSSPITHNQPTSLDGRRSRFNPRRRPTPSPHKTLTNEQTTEAALAQEPARITGVASGAILTLPPTTTVEPRLPPIVTYPPRRTPRVKSNLQIAQKNRWQRKKPGQNERLGKKVNVDLSNINFVAPDAVTEKVIDDVTERADDVVTEKAAVPVTKRVPGLAVTAGVRYEEEDVTENPRGISSTTTVQAITSDPIFEEAERDPELIPLRPDGKQPRVKSNIKARLANRGKLFNRNKFSRKVATVPASDQTRFEKSIDASTSSATKLNPDDHLPLVRPDGQTPRVKSDLKAKSRYIGNNGFKRKHPFRHRSRPKFSSSSRRGNKKPLITIRKQIQANNNNNNTDADDTEEDDDTADLSNTTLNTLINGDQKEEAQSSLSVSNSSITDTQKPVTNPSQSSEERRSNDTLNTSASNSRRVSTVLANLIEKHSKKRPDSSQSSLEVTPKPKSTFEPTPSPSSSSGSASTRLFPLLSGQVLNTRALNPTPTTRILNTRADQSSQAATEPTVAVKESQESDPLPNV